MFGLGQGERQRPRFSAGTAIGPVFGVGRDDDFLFDVCAASESSAFISKDANIARFEDVVIVPTIGIECPIVIRIDICCNV